MTWLAPLSVTILAAVAAFWIDRKDSPHYAVKQFIVFCLYLIAIIVSLAAWLVWAVVT